MLLKLAIVLLVPALALSQHVDLRPYDATAQTMFLLVDINADKEYSFSEIHSNFMNYDFDLDGRVSRYEYTNYVDQQEPQLHEYSQALYDIYDVDNDHFLDEHDFRNFHRLMDSDSDGIVTEAEFIRWMMIILEELEDLHLPPDARS